MGMCAAPRCLAVFRAPTPCTSAWLGCGVGAESQELECFARGWLAARHLQIQPSSRPALAQVWLSMDCKTQRDSQLSALRPSLSMREKIILWFVILLPNGELLLSGSSPPTLYDTSQLSVL